MSFKAKWKYPSGSPEYYSWRAMRARCLTPHHPAYQNYGGRGVKVCARWVDDFDAFYEDMAPRPAGTTLDRIDNNGDYSPENCRWTDTTTQLNNQRRNVRITHEGITLTVAEWERKLGLRKTTLRRRLSVYKMDLDTALTPGRIKNWRHGTRAGYEDHGCRCEECRAANTARHRAQRAKRRAKR